MFSVLNVAIEHITSVVFTCMVIVVFMQVMFRYVFRVPMGWTVELGMLLFVWVTFWGAAVALRRKEHIYVNAFLRRVPARVALICAFVYDIAILILFIFILIGFIVVMEAVRGSYMIAINWLPTSYVYLGAVIGVALLIIYLCQQILQRSASLQSRDRGRPK